MGLHLQDARVSAKGYANLKAVLPGVRVDWSERNRTAAETVLTGGGKISIRTEGQKEDRPVKAAGELPSEYFQVTRVCLAGVPKRLDDLVLKLSALNDPDFDHLEVLDLSGQPIQDCRPFEGLTHLKDLSLGRTKIDDAGLESLKNLKGLRRLVLDDCPINGTGLRHLKDLNNLTELSLACPSLKDLGMVFLSSLTKLERLSLAGSNQSDEGLKHLFRLTHLQELDLTGTKVSAAGKASLLKVLPKCRILDGSR
jgi:Leucine-rich repeat (LRR) protein